MLTEFVRRMKNAFFWTLRLTKYACPAFSFKKRFGREVKCHLQCISAKKTVKPIHRIHKESKTEMVAVLTFIKNFTYHFNLRNFNLRINNPVFSWLKRYSINEKITGQWIMLPDQYDENIQHRSSKSKEWPIL